MIVSRKIIQSIDTSRPMGKTELARQLYGEVYSDSYCRTLLAATIDRCHLTPRLRRMGLSPQAKLLQPPHLTLILTALLQELDDMERC